MLARLTKPNWQVAFDLYLVVLLIVQVVHMQRRLQFVLEPMLRQQELDQLALQRVLQFRLDHAAVFMKPK